MKKSYNYVNVYMKSCKCLLNIHMDIATMPASLKKQYVVLSYDYSVTLSNGHYRFL